MRINAMGSDNGDEKLAGEETLEKDGDKE